MSEDTNEATPVAELGFEAARDELIHVVRSLEAGGQDLDSSLKLWERGEALADHCASWLDAAQQRITDGDAETMTDAAYNAWRTDRDAGLVSVLIAEEYTELAVRVLHTAYGLDAVG